MKISKKVVIITIYIEFCLYLCMYLFIFHDSIYIIMRLSISIVYINISQNI